MAHMDKRTHQDIISEVSQFRILKFNTNFTAQFDNSWSYDRGRFQDGLSTHFSVVYIHTYKQAAIAGLGLVCCVERERVRVPAGSTLPLPAPPPALTELGDTETTVRGTDTGSCLKLHGTSIFILISSQTM